MTTRATSSRAVVPTNREEDEVAKGLREGEHVERGVRSDQTFRRVALTSFGVVFVGEWGDITQIATANYAALYHDPVAVAIGATLGLWAVAGLAVTAGKKVLDYVSVSLVRRITGVVLTLFAVLSAIQAVRG